MNGELSDWLAVLPKSRLNAFTEIFLGGRDERDRESLRNTMLAYVVSIVCWEAR